MGTAVVSTAVIPALAATSAEAATPARSDGLEEITLTVNGTNYPIAVDARWTLAEVLRDHLGLTGTKIGCNAGECGACTVMVEGKAVYSCSQLALWMDGKKITTVEGLASAGQLDPLQKDFIEHDAPQCGFCTSGQLMAAKARIAGPSGERAIPLEQFFVLPSLNARRENILKPDEILTAIAVPIAPVGTRSTYWKQMERDAWDFALSSVAAVVRQKDGKIEYARVVMGGVAPIPWRSKEAEAALIGKPLNESTAHEAADAALKPAHPLRDNAFKVDLARNILRSALIKLA